MKSHRYNTILCQVFSPCGKYYAAGSIYGTICVFDTNEMTKEEFQACDENGFSCLKCVARFQTENNSRVCSLTATEEFIIAGTIGEIHAWSWEDIGKSRSKLSWKINIPFSKENPQRVEVNCLVTCNDDDSYHCTSLYAGCGDNNIYVFLLEGGNCVKTFSGHKDYIHSIDKRGSTILSGSEDGSVIFWDLRTGGMANVLEPYKHDEASRPNIGKWISEVARNTNWILSGGGSRLCLWNERALDRPMTVYKSTKDEGIYTAKFYEDRIMAGGVSPVFSQLTYDDEIFTQIQTSASVVFSCVFQPQKMLVLAGNSDKIDVCKNFNYREYTFNFSKV